MIIHNFNQRVFIVPKDEKELKIGLRIQYVEKYNWETEILTISNIAKFAKQLKDGNKIRIFKLNPDDLTSVGKIINNINNTYIVEINNYEIEIIFTKQQNIPHEVVIKTLHNACTGNVKITVFKGYCNTLLELNEIINILSYEKE
jgi:hypothetical protein